MDYKQCIIGTPNCYTWFAHRGDSRKCSAAGVDDFTWGLSCLNYNPWVPTVPGASAVPAALLPATTATPPPIPTAAPPKLISPPVARAPAPAKSPPAAVAPAAAPVTVQPTSTNTTATATATSGSANDVVVRNNCNYTASVSMAYFTDSGSCEPACFTKWREVAPYDTIILKNNVSNSCYFLTGYLKDDPKYTFPQAGSCSEPDSCQFNMDYQPCTPGESGCYTWLEVQGEKDCRPPTQAYNWDLSCENYNASAAQMALGSATELAAVDAATEEKKSSAGAIAGGIIGGLLAAACLAMVALFLFKRHKAKKAEESDVLDVEQPNPFKNRRMFKATTKSPKVVDVEAVPASPAARAGVVIGADGRAAYQFARLWKSGNSTTSPGEEERFKTVQNGPNGFGIFNPAYTPPRDKLSHTDDEEEQPTEKTPAPEVMALATRPAASPEAPAAVPPSRLATLMVKGRALRQLLSTGGNSGGNTPPAPGPEDRLAGLSDSEDGDLLTLAAGAMKAFLRTHEPAAPLKDLLAWIKWHLAEPDSPLYKVSLTPDPAVKEWNQWQINWNDLRIVELLGSGGFGRVYLAQYRGAYIAVKLLLDPGTLGQPYGEVSVMGISEMDVRATSMLGRMPQEAAVLASLEHPNIATFVGASIFPPFVATEYCLRRSLYDVIKFARTDPKSAKELIWPRRLGLLVDAAKGLNYMHRRSQPVVHREFKSSNMLVTSTWHAKIVDLNLSRLLASSTRAAALSTHPRWVAPEVLLGEGATPASDVYAFGVVMWELLTWKLPWEGLSADKIRQNVLSGKRPEGRAQSESGDSLQPELLQKYLEILEQCWAQSPVKRPLMYVLIRELRILRRSCLTSSHYY